MLKVEDHIRKIYLIQFGIKTETLFFYLAGAVCFHTTLCQTNKPNFLSKIFTSSPVVALHQAALNTGIFPVS